VQGGATGDARGGLGGCRHLLLQLLHLCLELA